MTGRKLYIRTDMNEKIATGHVMRCLSVADAAKAMGVDTVFITADDSPSSFIEARGYESIVLGTDWEKPESELRAIADVIRKNTISKILVDSYQVTEKYLRELNKLAKVFYLDDLNAFPYPVHAVINYANYADDNFYPVRYPGTVYYLGCGYVPLRPEFRKPKHKKISKEVKNLLIMSGGSDPYDILPEILEAICVDEYTDINVICGRYNRNLPVLREKYSRHFSVHVLSHVDNIWEFYDEADVAVSAGGSTLYELASMGVPTITYSFADNQIGNVRSFARDELMPYAGDVRGGNVPARVASILEDFTSPEQRSTVSVKLHSLVDGCGAERFAKILLGNN
jgi:UDP-2,4-diacetamido-2,4,6-trideoxy-beta-L-altropyranose hydrolase